ncbi:MAG: winged helix-turn-helix domain-containing protein, partial [Sulfolobales archaeon]|nr:winged helix-turn-helix domain-containing protein [Sulfolobales archaeon]
ATCYVQGSLATVSTRLYVESEYITIPAIGRVLAIVNASRNTFVSYQSNYLDVLVLNPPANISVTYLTELFGYRDGEYYTEFYNPYRTLAVYLPLNSVVVEVSNLTHFRKTGEYYELVFSEGRVRLVYLSVEPGVSEVAGFSWIWIAVGTGAAAAGGALAYYVLVKRRREIRRLEVLDDRDRAIISALKSGPMTPQELIELTDISKATFYRRIKRLISMGYVEQVKKEGKVYYRLRKGSGS